jgi:hypothetical protein
MKQKSILYLILLGSMILAFFMFTGGVTGLADTVYNAPDLSDLILTNSTPVIYDRLPFRIQATNNSHKDKDCKDEYYSTRELIGSLVITQGNKVVVDTTRFILAGESQSAAGKAYTGTFVDTLTMNNPGTYTATAIFYNSNDPLQPKSTKTLTFTVGVGSVIPLTAGTYQLKTFTAQCASGGTYSYTNTASTNNLVINSDLVSASLNITMQMGASAFSQYPCLQDSSYNYNASGNYSIGLENGIEYFRIEYQNSAFVNFNFSYDGTNLTLNYSKNGSNFVMTFVKQ